MKNSSSPCGGGSRNGRVKTIGVLSLQGDFSKHRLRIETLGARAVAVRYPEELAGLHGLILPGGESTTMGKLLVRHRLLEALNRKVAEGLAVFATCAGTILLARRIDGVDQPHLGVMDIRVRRNAYGGSSKASKRISAFPPSALLRSAASSSGRPSFSRQARRWSSWALLKNAPS